MTFKATITTAAVKKHGVLQIASELRCAVTGLAIMERQEGNMLADLAHMELAKAIKVAEDKFRNDMAAARLERVLGK